MARINIDVTDVQGGANEFEPVPAGTYPAVIKEAEEKITKDGEGRMIKFNFEIVGPNYAGKHIWGYIITAHRDPQKLSMGRRHMANLLDALGTGRRIDDTDIFLGRMTPIKVKVQQATEQYAASNNIVEYGLGADPSFRPNNSYPQSSSVTIADTNSLGLQKPKSRF